MRVMSILGARPQFIKAAPVCRALAESGHEEFLVHTGQHYDYSMSDIFFDELRMPPPALNLGVGSGTHGYQTGQMLMRLEETMLEQRPDWVLIYGDTNSTLAAALAACKIGVPAAHVEAGLRSGNRQMPEEHNRVVADHVADLLLCPTQAAVDHLIREGLRSGVHLVGDTMYDAILMFEELASQRSTILRDHDLTVGEYYLATVHRPYNTDVPDNLREILFALQALPHPVVFPVHPRTRLKLSELGVESDAGLRMIEPVGYLDMLALEKSARIILTDSGGVQKEAFFLKVPCVTLRTETEWMETVEAGWNIVTGAASARILHAVEHFDSKPATATSPFGDGASSQRIVRILSEAAESL